MNTLRSRTRVGCRIQRPLIGGLFLSALTVFSGLIPYSAEAAPLFRFENRRENKGAFRLIPEITLLSSKQNYDGKGTKVPGGGIDTATDTTQELASYSRTQLDLFGVYGFSPALTFFGRLSMSSSKFETNTVLDANDSGVEGLQGSAAGLGDQAIGLNYRLKEFGDKSPGRRKTALDIQFQIDFPFYDTAKNRTEEKPLQGDGTTDITISPFITMPLNQGRGSRFYLMGGLGYTARTKGYSAVLPFQLSAVMLPEKEGLMLRAGLYGYKSMSSDVDGEPVKQAEGASVRDAGGSFIVNAVNSAYTAGRLVLGYQTASSTQYYIGLTSLLAGTSTASVTAFHLGAQFRWAGKARSGGSVPTGYGSGTVGSSRSTDPARYDLQSQVTKAKPEMKIAQVNKGSADGVAPGQQFDFFRNDGGRLTLVARGQVTKVGAKAANISIHTYYQQVLIQPGFIARRIAP